MGFLDSSFLFLPFGNDLLVVTLVTRNHRGLPWYVIGAAAGSTLGVLLLARIARGLGEEGIKNMAGPKKFDRLSKLIEKHGGKAIALACIAPPPFPFTMVVAAAAALDYSVLRLCLINFLTRGIRFLALGLLAIRYGSSFLKIADSTAFRSVMLVFITLCIAGSGLSIYQWLHHSKGGNASV